MKIRTLTDKAIRNAKLSPGKKKESFTVDRGLSVEIKATKTGQTASYVYRYTLNGKRITEYLGSVNDLSLSLARKMLEERRSLVSEGKKAKEEIKKTIKIKQAENERKTYLFKDALDQFLRLRQDFSPDTKRGTKYLLKKIEPLYFTPWDEITFEHGKEFVNKELDNGHPTAAKAVKSVLYNVAEIAIDLGYIQHNPFSRLKRLLPKNYKETHFRSVNEESPESDIVKIFKSFAENKIKEKYIKLFLLIMFTLLRPTNAIFLRIEDVDFKARVVSVPTTKTLKYGWKIYITDDFYDLLKLFIGKRTSGYILENATRSHKDMLNLYLRNHNLPLTCHGCRAAGANWMVHNDIEPHIADACLSHGFNEKTKTAYIRTKYYKERAAALEKWHHFLINLTKTYLKDKLHLTF